MELRSVLSSGVVRFVESIAEGQIVLGQDVVQAVVERYRFWQFPTKPAEFNLDDSSVGATFESGVFDNTLIKRLRLYRRGIAAEVEEASTDTVVSFLDDLLGYGASRFKIAFKDAGPAKYGFNSSLEIQMSETFGHRLDSLSKAASAIDSALARHGFKDTAYQFGSLAFHPDNTAQPVTPGQFSIERRVNYLLKDNIYYSQAPLATADHLRVLEVLDSSF